MHIVTGPNGSGKSIFLRQIFLLQVIAQVGCFVPAETATFRVCDILLARVYLEDNMDCGMSAFGVEVSETFICCKIQILYCVVHLHNCTL